MMRDSLKLEEFTAEWQRQAEKQKRSRQEGNIIFYILIGGGLFVFFFGGESLDYFALGFLSRVGFGTIITALLYAYLCWQTLVQWRREGQRLEALQPRLRELIPGLPPRPRLRLPWSLMILTALIVIFCLIGVAWFHDISLGVAVGAMVALLVNRFLYNLYIDTYVRWFIKGAFYRGDYAAAIQRIESAIRLFPQLAFLQSLRGTFFMFAGRFAEAEVALRQVIPKLQNERANLSVALNNLGLTLKALGQVENGFTLVEAAIAFCPENNLFSSLSSIYIDQNTELERGLELVEFGLSLLPKPKSNRRLQVDKWCGIKGNEARLLALLGKDIRADAAVTEMLETADPAFIPGLAGLNLDAGYVRQTQGDLQVARDHFQRAIQLNPNGQTAKEAAKVLTALPQDDIHA